MMRAMKLAGNQLLFGEGCLEYIRTLTYQRVSIVLGGSSMYKNGILHKVKGLFEENGAVVSIIEGVEPDPAFATVLRGAKEMLAERPDLIVALGGGSVMDAAKTMWIYYENPQFKKLEDILPPNPFPVLRKKAHFCCIPSTAGTASEVSRSVVISDNETGMKHGIGNMEMMPDIAICDPSVTCSMPPHITAETGMDALTHAVEALASTRANYIGNILALQAALDIMEYLPQAYKNGQDLGVRERMLNASMAAGIAFTNVSLGIVHSMAHTLGGFFHISHGLGDAMLLPYVVRFNSRDWRAKGIYTDLARKAGGENLADLIAALNEQLHIPSCLREVIEDEEKYNSLLHEMAGTAMEDGCTKTNPVIPSLEEFVELFKKAYRGE